MLASYSFAILGLWLILATVFVQAMVASVAHRRQKHYVPGIVNDKLSHESFVFRSHRTFLNSHENLLMMFGSALLGMLVGMDAYWLGMLVWVYAIARVLHMALYYALATETNPSPRSYFFMVGFIANLVLLIMLGLHLAA
jgi:glutathione S-transferase